jgi:DNA invertase Pin-like site-specific DNA recombinase
MATDEPAPDAEVRPTRCAIYTRKSTEEGLAQEFNSLDAQREAAEAYILSQRELGWAVMADRYDDGGFTGGNMERPALQRLLADIEARRIDCVVVYKVDRLSRSLLDFARIMAQFEARSVSFVSVTQQFNTTVSLGRLTLNILLSFAQFEREIIAERTRDKVSAARRKGRWSGGIPVLGYDVDAAGGRLLVNSQEAERVRGIFELFAATGDLSATVIELDVRKWTTKKWVTSDGKLYAGQPFTVRSLLRLLGNVLYTGAVQHKGRIYSGEHPAIIEPGLWQEVNRRLPVKAERKPPGVRRHRGSGRRCPAQGDATTTAAPRIARLLALAIRFEAMLRAGEVHSYAELARLGSVSAARITQIINLLNLSPAIQEQILFLSGNEAGAIVERNLRSIARVSDFEQQEHLFAQLLSTA